MDQPSSSRDPLLTRGGDSDSDSGESVEKHAYDDDSNIWESLYFADIDEDQTLTPISQSTVVESVDANVLRLPREDQRFSFVEVSPDWSLVVTITSDGTFSVWDATDEWVLVSSKRLHHDGRTLKRIAFDPYNEKAVLLCFDLGEIVQASLKGLATVGAPGSSQDGGPFHMELVYKCEGRTDSRFDHFTFSSDRKTMVYYNLDGEFIAVQFKQQGELKSISLSKDFVLKTEPNIYVYKQCALVTAAMKSSEDSESTAAKIETLVWTKFEFGAIKIQSSLVRLEGKCYLSNDGQYVLSSVLAIEDKSWCCQIKMHLAEDIKWRWSTKCNPIATKTLKFASNYPHLECLDRNQFKSLHANDGNIMPLVAIHQTNYVGSRLLFWDTDSDTLVYEIDLILNKVVKTFCEVMYCWSTDHKWIGACSIGARMVGLICARSGVFAWKANVTYIRREDMGFCSLSFDPAGTRLMVSFSKVIYLFEPPCLSKKPQKHPMRHNLLLSQAFGRKSDFEVLEMAKEWPKQCLFNVFSPCQRVEPRYQDLLLDVAISLFSKSLAIIYKTYEGRSFLSILHYTKTSSWESLWLVAMLRWNKYFLANIALPLVKEVGGDRAHKCLSVFYYPKEGTSDEQVILLSSEGGVDMLDLDSNLEELSEWKNLSNESCFSFAQTKDRRRVISLGDKNVLIIDLNGKSITRNVPYSFGLSQWWDSFFDYIWLLGFSHYYGLIGQECDKERKLFLQERFCGLFDVSDDGKKIFIGFDCKQNKSLILTPDKSEGQFRTEWDEARDSLCQCSMLTENGKWLGFIDYEKLRHGNIVVCVVNTERSDESFVKLSASKPLLAANFLFQIDKIEEDLTILVLERVKNRATVKKFSLKLLNEDECAPVHDPLLSTIVQPTNLDAYGKGDQPATLNMRVANISNFRRILMEEGKDKLEIIARKALDNKVKVSDVYKFFKEKDHNYITLLRHSLEKKETPMVQLCLDFIKDGLFPFHSSCATVTDSFFDLYFSYNELFFPMLKNDFLTLNIAEVLVPAQLYQSKNGLSDVVFASDTVLESDEHFVNMANEHLGKTKCKKDPILASDDEEGIRVLSCVYFFYIANACKVGLNGILRKLLMKDVALKTFNTGVVRATVCWKWEKLWKQRCLRELYMYLVFLALFTTYAICIGVLGDRLVHHLWTRLCLSSLLAGVFLLAIRISFDEYKQLRTYIEDGEKVFNSRRWGYRHYFWKSKWNLVDICSYFLVLVLIPIFHTLFVFEKCPKEPLFAIIAIESLLAWFKLWYYAQPFEQTSALVLLIRNVVADCLPFLGLASVALVGFGVALFVLFQCCSISSSTNITEREDGGDDDDDEGDLIHESFGSVRRSLSTLFYAMVGTFEPEVYYKHWSLSWLTTSVFVLYIIVEMIVMLNMLIAIMGDAYDRIKIEEDVQIIFSRALFIDAYEATLSATQIREAEKKIGKFLYVLVPKEGKTNIKKAKWKGRINAIEENVKKTVNLLEASVMSAIRENKKAINDNREEMENKINQRFHQMESIFRNTLEEHKILQEEHWLKEQDLLRSIGERIETLEVETNRLASSCSNPFTSEKEEGLHTGYTPGGI